MDLSKLDEPFDASDIEWRVQSCGKTKDNKFWCLVLAYVTNRAIQQRLDDVCGKANWRNDYSPAPDGGVMCSISIKIGDEWVTKKDGAENTQVEAVKGGISGAMKRAGVQWGIGRYLYKLTESFATCSTDKQKGWNRASTKNKDVFYWETPTLPDWALPANTKTKKDESKESESSFDILANFIKNASSSETFGELKEHFKSAYRALNGTKEQAESKAIYDREKQRFEGQK